MHMNAVGPLGLGAGVLGNTGSMGVLGLGLGDNGSFDYPWGEFDAGTQSVQFFLNLLGRTELVLFGLPPRCQLSGLLLKIGKIRGNRLDF